VGGTILGTALAVLAARGEKPVHSVTFLTALLDFTDTGVLDIFIDEQAVRFREMQMGQGGLLKGQDLAFHLQLFAAQRFGVELRGGQLPQGRDTAAL
jgi:poly(3-hydroxyalkanoate) synthetase